MFQRALGVGPRNAETPLLSSWLMSPGGETGAKKVTLWSRHEVRHRDGWRRWGAGSKGVWEEGSFRSVLD